MAPRTSNPLQAGAANAVKSSAAPDTKKPTDGAAASVSKGTKRATSKPAAKAPKTVPAVKQTTTAKPKPETPKPKNTTSASARGVQSMTAKDAKALGLDPGPYGKASK